MADLLRAGYEAFNRRDSARLRELMVDDFHWNEAAEVPGRKECASAEEFLAYMEGFDLMWDEFAFELLDLRRAASDVVIATVLGTGRGRASGAGVELTIRHVWRFRDGRVARMDAFLDEHAAEDAARGER